MRGITLALGGGGIKGFAHVGVLRVLEREGFRIQAIAGTSAGGMVGACYAAGSSPDELERCLLEMDQDRLYARQPGDGPAMMGLGGVLNMLNQLLGEKTFQDVRLPLAVTAVNLETAQLLALRRGRLLDAVLATIAVPGVFPPRRWEGQTLVDGGILDPVPVALARYLTPSNPVVAVVLSPPPSEWVRPTPPRLFASLPFVSSYVGRMRLAQALNIFLRSIDIAGLELTELRLQIDQPEIIIRPAVPHIGFMDMVNVHEVVELGEQAAIEALPELRRAVGLRGWFSQRASRHRLPKTVLDWEKDCE